jgi:hypothetical protein
VKGASERADVAGVGFYIRKQPIGTGQEAHSAVGQSPAGSEVVGATSDGPA